jgi:hypothetical protein
VNLSLYELRLILVVILCIPVIYFGVRFAGSLVDQALAGRKKTDTSKKDGKRRGRSHTDIDIDIDTEGSHHERR